MHLYTYIRTYVWARELRVYIRIFAQVHKRYTCEFFELSCGACIAPTHQSSIRYTVHTVNSHWDVREQYICILCKRAGNNYTSTPRDREKANANGPTYTESRYIDGRGSLNNRWAGQCAPPFDPTRSKLAETRERPARVTLPVPESRVDEEVHARLLLTGCRYSAIVRSAL